MGVILMRSAVAVYSHGLAKKGWVKETQQKYRKEEKG